MFKEVTTHFSGIASTIANVLFHSLCLSLLHVLYNIMSWENESFTKDPLA